VTYIVLVYVKLPPVPKHHAMKAYRGIGSTAPCILNFISSWSSVVSFSFISFNPGEIAFGTCWVGGWMYPRAGLVVVSKMNILPWTGIEP